jgi:hypothetical protein
MNTQIELLWTHLTMVDLKYMKDKIEYLLNEFGTKVYGNRFMVGYCIENIVEDHLESNGFLIQRLPNSERIDFIINNSLSLSLKYSSTGDITIHNSNSCINKDEKFTDVLLITIEKIYLITSYGLDIYQININNYLINKGDSLKLKRSFLKFLEKENYKYILDFNLNVDKSKCQNKLLTDLCYKTFSKEYKNQTNNDSL